MDGESPVPDAAPDNPATGRDSAARLAGLDTQQRSIDTEVQGGRLAIGSEVAQRAAGLCRDHGARLRELRAEIDALGQPVSFGDCKVGEQLAAKFAAKAATGPDSLADLLTAAERIVDDLAQTYAAAGSAYRQADASGVAALHRAGRA